MIAPGEDIPPRRGITLRQVAPNAVTAMALCFGLTGIMFGVRGEWEKAAGAIIFAGVLDGLDGRIARLLKGESRFGAELDSLSDVIAFGVAPALVIYLWSLQNLPKFGWIIALAHAVCCALRLARFNANIDSDDQPHKSAGFLTGVPAPAGAGLAFVPLYLWLSTGLEIFRASYIVAPWVAVIAFLMISNVATFSWSSLRLRKNIRLEAIAFVGLLSAALITAPWPTLLGVALFYLALIPLGIASYAKVRRQRG
ncbi:CDP-alcohol phosphatidyltransferase family protein [Rhizorhapis suberifaciens]|uniref:CDP-diacylglycerol--serine O-phosphatidyltransferase n=1 Tax=Rhizorhapis suberifaciens TaxID=13656 RepID=A0A840HSH3_9SPHN|nr:phosphatidylcholine/phosphatidylserine synthase [Rhizorhapis suberifaciens]MBB4640518.1 CDP-diacylglycerol--serine O-phosphatidyltransferase [Rhizorhapis suberifaciens]